MELSRAAASSMVYHSLVCLVVFYFFGPFTLAQGLLGIISISTAYAKMEERKER